MRDITSRKEYEFKLKESKEQLKELLAQKDTFVNLIGFLSIDTICLSILL